MHETAKAGAGAALAARGLPVVRNDQTKIVSAFHSFDTEISTFELFDKLVTDGWVSPDEGSAQVVMSQVHVDFSAGQLRASGPENVNNRWYSVSYEVFVPRNADLSLKTHNGGISIADVRGNIQFDALNGGVNLKNLAGDVEGTTKNGGLNYVSRGILNVPIIDGTLGLRFGVQTSRSSGYVDHLDLNGVVDRKGINANRADVGKLLISYIPTSDLTISVSEFAQRTVMDDTGLVDFQTPNYFINKLVLEPGRDTFAVSTVKIAYDLHWADLTSISSYAYRSFPRTTDGTYFNSQFVGYFVDNILGLPGLDGNLDGYRLAALPGPVYNTLTTKQPTEELRLSSKAYDPKAGVGLPHQSGLQYALLPKVAKEAAQPGDLLFYHTPISHVAIYIGGGKMIHAPSPGTPLRVAK